MVLVLVNTFLFSLAIGVMSSALSRDYRRAMAANFFLLLCLAAAPPACASVIAACRPSNQFPPALLYSCPVYTFFTAFDILYLSRRVDFWWSLGLTHALVWLLVGLASRVVPHTWQDRPSKAGRNLWREFWQWLSLGRKSKQAEYRRRLLNINAYYWLAGRARLKPVHVWVFLGCIALWWVIGWLAAGALWMDESVPVTTALLLNTTLKMWVVIEAGQRLAEDQHAGALELLLSTPLSVTDILRGQWLALRRQFLNPLLAVLALELVLAILMWRRSSDGRIATFFAAGMLMLVADVFALGWVAMRAALTARNPNRATIAAVVRILVAPWVAASLVWALVNAWFVLTSDNAWNPSWKVGLGLWFGCGLAADVIFGLLAWWQLRSRFRQYALRRYAPAPTRFSRWFHRRRPVAARMASGQRVFGRGPKRPWWRRKAVVAASVLVLAGVGMGWSQWRSRPVYSPVVTVSLATSNTPIWISAWGQTLMMVLPDGSLWRWGQIWPVDERRFVAPERIGTNDGWVKVSFSANRCTALRRDGSLWEGKQINLGIDEPLTPVATGHEWLDVAGYGVATYGIRRDGTLWVWNEAAATRYALKGGPSVLAPPGSNSVQAASTAPIAPASSSIKASTRAGDGSIGRMTQVGTNRNWAALKGSGANCVLALQTDGTLWAWGFLRPAWSPQGMIWFTNALTPVQLCSNTNWVTISSMFGGLSVWNRSGELWDPFVQPPHAEASVASVGRLILANASPSRVAMAYCGLSEWFQVRTNGTLWRKSDASAPWSGAPEGAWRQVGARTDWVFVWGGAGVAIGQTADGTLWTWGADLTRQASPDLSTRLQIARARLAGIFGTGSRAGLGLGGFKAPVFVRDPRPFMKLELVPPGN